MFVNSPNDFPASFNWSRYTVAYSAIPTTLASVETNQEIMIFMGKKKALQVQPFREKTRETKVI